MMLSCVCLATKAAAVTLLLRAAVAGTAALQQQCLYADRRLLLLLATLSTINAKPCNTSLGLCLTMLRLLRDLLPRSCCLRDPAACC
jgi:hypothetical protein